MENQIRKKIVHKFLENPTWSGSLIAKKLKLPKSTVNDVIKRYKETLSTNRKQKKSKKVSKRDQELTKRVLRSIKSNPGLSDRAKKCKTSVSTARRIRLDAGLQSYRVIKYPNRNEKQNGVAKKRARLLYEQILTKFNNCLIWMMDETYVKMDLKQLPGPKFYVAESR